MARGESVHPSPSLTWVLCGLLVGVWLGGILIIGLQFFFLPFLFLGTSGAVVGTAVALCLVVEFQRGLVDVFTDWRPSRAELFLSAVPGLAVGVLALRGGAGWLFAPVPGVTVQAVLLIFVAPEGGPRRAQAAAPAVPAPALPAAAPPVPNDPPVVPDDVHWRG